VLAWKAVPSQRTLLRLDTPERWRALASPVRQRIVGLLEDERWWTADELANALVTTVSSLEPHLEKLHAVGILTRSAKDEVPRVRLAGAVVPTSQLGGESFSVLYARTMEQMLAHSSRAKRPRAAETPEEWRNLVERWTLRVTPAQAARLRTKAKALRDEVMTLVRQSDPDATTRERLVPLDVLLGFSVVPDEGCDD
jgi:hypothetical protein